MRLKLIFLLARRRQAEADRKAIRGYHPSPSFIPCGSGGVPYPFPHPRKWGGYFNPGVRIRWLRKKPHDFGVLGRTAQQSHFGPPRPPESDSRPGFCTERTEDLLIRSILEPFGEDFLPNQAKSEPTNLGEPGYGFLHFFFNWGTWILKVPKRPRKRHNWIAELASFKMR